MKIEWTEPAQSDLEAIKNYIKQDSEFYAERFVQRIFEAVERLVEFPKSGRIVKEANDESIREIIFHNYRIIYRIERERILIVTVIHGSRDLGAANPKPWEIS